jgi:hypothetical protein
MACVHVDEVIGGVWCAQVSELFVTNCDTVIFQALLRNHDSAMKLRNMGSLLRGGQGMLDHLF